MSEILIDTSDTWRKICVNSWEQDINPRANYPTDLQICLTLFFFPFWYFSLEQWMIILEILLED